MLNKAAITKLQAVIIAVIIIVAGVVGAVYMVTRPVLPPKNEIVIGWSHPTTGPTAGTAAVHHLYYKMIIDDYNAKYGGLNVPGYGLLPITWIEYDDTYNLDTSRANILKLINEDKVDLLFAPWSTTFCVAALPLFEQYQYPVIGLTVGSNTLQDLLQAGVYKYFFVTLGQPREDAKEVKDMVTYINAQYPSMPISKVGFAYRADEHGIEHAVAIKAGLEAIGISVPVYQSYDPTPPGPSTDDWTAIIKKFSDNNVDAVIVCSYDEGATFVQTCIAQDYNPKMLIVGPALETPFLVYDVFQFTHEQFTGIAYYNGFPATTFNTTELQAFVQHHLNYTATHGLNFPYLPFPASAVFYSGLECLFKAVESVGLDRPAIRNALNTTTFSTTYCGNFKFRVGLSPLVENHGTLTQWQGGDMMEVIWPRAAASANIIYPKPTWNQTA